MEAINVYQQLVVKACNKNGSVTNTISVYVLYI